jgi:hypothetical protein
VIDYTAVALFGLVAGAAEIVSRYRDAPWTAVRRFPGIVYLSINALAGMGGLLAVEALDLRFGFQPGEQLRWARVLVAGFSSVALFRSSLFTIRAGEKDVPIGPAAALQAILATLDRDVDRKQASDRDRFVESLAEDIGGEPNRLRFLGAYCLGLMQNVPAGEQNQLREQITTVIQDKKLTPRERLLLVCLQLLAVVGHDVLAKAINRLKSLPPTQQVEEEVPEPPPPLALDEPLDESQSG